MFKDYTLQTTWGRALAALAVGVFVATAIVDSYSYLKWNVYYGGYITLFKPVGDLDAALTLALLLASPLIGWGIWAALFSPFWLLLHKFGYRTWLSLLLCGFAFSSIFYFVGATNFLSGTRELPELVGKLPFFNKDPHWDGTTLTMLGWKRAALRAAGTGAAAAASALSIWRFAYRRPAPC